jgi:hypothetical protein
MSGGSSWRSPSTADQYRHHDYADFAQEFLQSQRGLPQDHAETQDGPHRPVPLKPSTEEEGLARRWGLSFPHRSPCRPARTPGAVVAGGRARRGDPSNRRPGARDPASAGSEPLAEVSDGRERHLVIAHGTARLRLCLRMPPGRRVPSDFSISCDRCAALRLAAAARFERVTRGTGLARPGSARPPLINVRALPSCFDPRRAGGWCLLARPRLRPRLSGPSPACRSDWKGSGERRHVLRLIADARRLVAADIASCSVHD